MKKMAFAISNVWVVMRIQLSAPMVLYIITDMHMQEVGRRSLLCKLNCQTKPVRMVLVLE